MIETLQAQKKRTHALVAFGLREVQTQKYKAQSGEQEGICGFTQKVDAGQSCDDGDRKN